MGYLNPTEGNARGGSQAAALTTTSVAAAGATPTKAEYDALRADFLALVTSLRNAGQLAS